MLFSYFTSRASQWIEENFSVGKLMGRNFLLGPREERLFLLWSYSLDFLQKKSNYVYIQLLHISRL